jgi:cysteine-rich repeat protein
MGIDRDEDTLPNGVETNTGVFQSPSDTGTSPALADTDGDGSNDDVEIAAGTDPNSALSFPGGPVCGDTVVEAPEQCDDGNTTPGDGCSALCQIEAPVAVPALDVFGMLGLIVLLTSAVGSIVLRPRES